MHILGRLASIAVLVTGLVLAPPAPGVAADACNPGDPAAEGCVDPLLLLGGLEDDDSSSMDVPAVAGTAIDFDDDDLDLAVPSSGFAMPVAIVTPREQPSERTSGSIARPRGGRSPPPDPDAHLLRATDWPVIVPGRPGTAPRARPTQRSAPSAAAPTSLVGGRTRGRSGAPAHSESLLVPAPTDVDAGPDRVAASVRGRFPAPWEVPMASG